MQGMAVKQRPQYLEFPVAVTQSVSVSQEKLLSVNLTGQRFPVNDDSTFLFQVIPAPDIVVADEEMYLHSQIRQFRQLSQEAGIPLGNHQFELIPEVEHVAQQVYGCRLMLDAVQKVHQPAFLGTSVRDGP